MTKGIYKNPFGEECEVVRFANRPFQRFGEYFKFAMVKDEKVMATSDFKHPLTDSFCIRNRQGWFIELKPGDLVEIHNEGLEKVTQEKEFYLYINRTV